MPSPTAAEDTTKFWKDWFDDCARHATSDYALNRGTTMRLGSIETEAEKQLLADVAPRATDMILDAGCGSGRNISLLAPKVAGIVGLDFSSEMLVRLGARIAEERLSNVTLQQGSVTRLEFPDQSFDKVLCISVLQYLDNESCRTAFQEMFRVCKPGGRIVIHIKNGTSLYGLSKRMANFAFSLLRKKGLPEYYRSRSLHRAMIKEQNGTILEETSFGILTFIGLPRSLVRHVLALETKVCRAKWIRRLGVNYRMTIQVGNR